MGSLSIPYCFLIILILGLFVAKSLGQESQKQFVNLYEIANCQDEHFLQSFTSSSNLSGMALSRTPSLFVNGMWQIAECRFSTGEGCTSTTLISNRGACHNLPSGLRGDSIFVNKFGDEFQNESIVHMYTSPEFQGVAYRVNQDGLNFPRGLNVTSWFFTGDHKWALFEEANYTGKMSCLTPVDGEVISKQYGFTWSINSKIQVRSIRYGDEDECEGGEGSGGGGRWGPRSTLLAIFTIYVYFNSLFF